MNIFISWSGTRSEKIALAFEDLLTHVFPEMEAPFLSKGIRGGDDWRQKLHQKLNASQAIIFCFTPEATTSGWVLYEAGYMAAKEDGLFYPFVYGTEVPDPLRNIQAKALTQETVKEMVDSLAERQHLVVTEVSVAFDDHWPAFDEAIRRLVLLPISEFIPAAQFADCFDRKTFHEPFPDCLDMRWMDRYDAVGRARQLLASKETKRALSTDDYVMGAFRELGKQLDRYQMLIGGALLREVNWDDLPERHRQSLERCREEIVRLVRDFDKPSRLPIFEESISYASADTETRKDTIHTFEDKIRNNTIDLQSLKGVLAESGWDLDRIVRYVAWREHKSKSSLDDRVAAVRREEERARTRGLIRGLQPLYYALEAFDDLFPNDDCDRCQLESLDTEIYEIVAAVHRFVKQREDRDSGGHIAGRVRSIRRKLHAAGYEDTGLNAFVQENGTNVQELRKRIRHLEALVAEKAQ